jgi:hypothetical protein
MMRELRNFFFGSEEVRIQRKIQRFRNIAEEGHDETYWSNIVDAVFKLTKNQKEVLMVCRAIKDIFKTYYSINSGGKFYLNGTNGSDDQEKTKLTTLINIIVDYVRKGNFKISRPILVVEEEHEIYGSSMTDNSAPKLTEEQKREIIGDRILLGSATKRIISGYDVSYVGGGGSGIELGSETFSFFYANFILTNTIHA